MNVVTKTFQFGGQEVTLETGRIARQASGAVMVTMGTTSVLCTVVADPKEKPGQAFFPLSVHYIEKAYSVGKIPGGFFKREARPSEKETLTSRLIDRPIRPLFADGFMNEVQVVCTVMSADFDTDPDIPAMIGTSAALAISGCPFNGPIGGARVGFSEADGYVLNPGYAALKNSQLDMVVAGTRDAVLMVESEAKELSEDQMLGAVLFAHQEMQTVIKAIDELVEEAGKPRWDWSAAEVNETLRAQVEEAAGVDLGEAYRITEKAARYERVGHVRDAIMAQLATEDGASADDIKDEFKAIMGMYQEAYDILGLDTFHVRLSKWDPQDPKGKEKYVDNPEAWQESEQILEEVLVELGIDFKVGIGEGAFYGPKIDIQFNTVTGREESVSTVQLDFAVPGRMNLKYVGSDGEEHTPYCIHRAPFSTHERMVAFLIEHYGGAFPTWLAPIQVQMLTVSEQYDDYANDIVRRLRGQMVRAELAPSNDTLPKKIRQGATRKIPNLLIIGEREVADGTVTLRRYGQRDQHTMSVEAFESALMHAIRRRLPEVAVADEG